ncbi:hypothetical protein BFP72_07040 [Reichenbachiella sp. 5M10]|nr:hypothetical protein BFP72_07040 [Reichenbachiella sp. 5M10]
MDEAELVTRCKAFDATAQKLLYEKYAEKMYGLCFRYLATEDEAEDTVTEGFVKIFAKFNSFEYRGKGSLEGWMKRIMVNESLMLLRKRRQSFVEISQSDAKMKFSNNVDQKLIEEDIIEEIKKLPKGYRTVFNLYAIEGYSHKEIGEKLGISENTSKSQLSKARASLIKSLVRIGAI